MQGIAPRLQTFLRPAIAALLALGLVTAGPAAASTIYKSVDEKGNVQFSQTPPKDRQSEAVDSSYAKPAEQPEGAEEDSADASDDPATDPSTEVKVRDSEKAREACEKAKEQRAAIANAGNDLMVQDDEGKYQPMSEEQRAKRIERLDAIIEDACAGDADEE
ncbi:MAG: DUF4124 domain-containing protein [Guyparkeria sp.]|uniref:DUF4124 domain-containing protein n=1 Tax=Guyparkeria sp. TaxID=2035736 RepID=UPI00397D97E5